MISSGLMIIPVGEGEPAPVPLTGVSVKVRIVDLVAEVNIEQRYVNQENQPIGAFYKFHLDEGAAVCSFTAEVDGRTIQGVVKETEEAKTDYEEAIRSGHTAFLVEEKLPDVFKAKVGNLGPGSGARICISYVTELKVEGGEIRFYLPTTIAPRYITPRSEAPSVAGDSASINYISHSHDYTFDFEASLKMGSAVRDIRSPTHKITSSNNDTNAVVKLDEIVTSMDRDLVLYIQVVEPHKAHLLTEKSNGSTALMLSLVPSFKLQEQKTELIFVVDHSGSMQGTGIEQAKNALLSFLHSLPTDCYVNIVGFSSTYHFLFPVSEKRSDEVLKHSIDHIESLDVKLGGAEMFAPLEALLAQQTIDGYRRQIFIITSGEVSNPDQVLSLVRRQSGKARVFALGLGSSPSHHLVEGIARAGNGTALFASLEEGLEKKVMQQLEDALQSSLTNIQVTWDGYEEKENYSEKNKLRQAPCDEMIPPIFDGRHLAVYALLQEGARVPQFVKLVANSPVGPLSVQVPLNNTSDIEEDLLLHRMAAKKLIQLLQDRQVDHENCKKEIVDLGCTYGLASRYTSYVAIDPKTQSDIVRKYSLISYISLFDIVPIGPRGMMMKPSAASTPVAMAYRSLAPAAKRMAMRPDWLAEDMMDLCVEARARAGDDVNLVRELINRHAVPAVDAEINFSCRNTQLKLVRLLSEETEADLEKAGKELTDLNEIKLQIAKNIVIDHINSNLTDVQYAHLENLLLLDFIPLSDHDEIGDIRKDLCEKFGHTMERCPYLAFTCYIYALDVDSDFIASVKTSLRDERISRYLGHQQLNFTARF